MIRYRNSIISVPYENRLALKGLGSAGESFNDVISGILRGPRDAEQKINLSEPGWLHTGSIRLLTTKNHAFTITGTNIVSEIDSGHTNTNTVTHQDKNYWITDVVTQCLTERCQDCTGLYVSWSLRHRFVCRCTCHSVAEAS